MDLARANTGESTTDARGILPAHDDVPISRQLRRMEPREFP